MSETPTNEGHLRRGWLTTLARLWLLRPVNSLPDGSPRRAILVMGATWLAAWVAIDRWQSQPDPQFLPGGIPLLAWYVLAILGLTAVLQWRVRPGLPGGTRPALGSAMACGSAPLLASAPTFLLMLTLAMGAVPVPLLFASVAAFLSPSWFVGAVMAVAAYTLLYLARGLHALAGETRRAAACAGLAFITGFCWLTDTLDVIPDVWSPLESNAAQAVAPADGEAILFEQARRIDGVLAGIAREASPAPQAFFLGFAGVGDEKVFAQEIGLASRVLGERYGVSGRSVQLINDQRDLERAPLATLSGLKYALRGLGARMNLSQDVLFLAISSHGAADTAIIVSNSGLPLDDLTDEDLAAALRESGIKWRVIIISACYAGGFIDSLRDPQTIVIAAAAADRTSFGCSNDRDLTYFGEAFYRDALPGSRSLREAFESAKAAIAIREQDEHVTPSDPQAYFGVEMQAKLGSMNRP